MPQPLNFPIPIPENSTREAENLTITRAFWIILGVTTLLRLVYAVSLPLSGDEAYFWEWARHPALCYYDHPPMAGWILWVTRHLFGDTVLAVRIVAVGTGSAITIVIYRYAMDITGSARSAAWTGMLAMGVPVLAALGVLYSTDTPVLAAGTLGGYLFHRAVNRGDQKYWPLAGLCFAVLLGSKFLGVPIIAASGLYLILRPDRRVLLKTTGPYLAWGLSILGLIPVLIWNAKNGWATFIFNFGSRHASSSLSLGNVLDYLAGQMLGLSPLLLILGVPVLASACFPWRGKDGDRMTVIFLSLVPLGGFLVLSLTTRVGVHWPAVGVPFLVVAVGAGLTRVKPPGRLFFATLALAWITTALLFIIPIVPRLLPADWEYPLRSKRINTRQLKKMVASPGEVGVRIDSELEHLRGTGEAFVFTRSYALSSLTAFYIPSHPEVTVLGGGSVHGRNHLFWFDPAEHAGQNALYVSYRSAQREISFVQGFFEKWEVVSDSASPGEIPVTVIRCYGYNGLR